MEKRKKINLFVYAIVNGGKRHFFVLSIKMQKGVDLNGGYKSTVLGRRNVP